MIVCQSRRYGTNHETSFQTVFFCSSEVLSFAKQIARHVQIDINAPDGFNCDSGAARIGT